MRALFTVVLFLICVPSFSQSYEDRDSIVYQIDSSIDTNALKRLLEDYEGGREDSSVFSISRRIHEETLKIQFQREKEERIAAWIIFSLFGIVFVLVLIYYLRAIRYDRDWDEGVFPSKLEFKQDNLLKAYVRLAARLIQSDTEDVREKINYINSYFIRYFPGTAYDFRETLTHAYKHPIKLKTASFWLNKHLMAKSKRMQVMYFLVGLAFVDGSVNRREFKLLEQMNAQLQLSQRDFRSIINMYQGYEQASQQQRTQEAKASKRISLRKINAEILGVSEHASMDEIKKAYRRLVKIHHPDRFATESKAQQAIAQERFVKIQKAYEFFEG